MTAPLPPLLLRGDCLVELARIPDESVAADRGTDREGDEVTEWNGPPCGMCNGTGVARFTPAPPAEPYDHRCPACNGHGREPS